MGSSREKSLQGKFAILTKFLSKSRLSFIPTIDELKRVKEDGARDLEALQKCHEESMEEMSMTIADLLEQKRILELQLQKNGIEPGTCHM